MTSSPFGWVPDYYGNTGNFVPVYYYGGIVDDCRASNKESAKIVTLSSPPSIKQNTLKLSHILQKSEHALLQNRQTDYHPKSSINHPPKKRKQSIITTSQQISPFKRCTTNSRSWYFSN